jgi:translation initiation factor IF-3
VASLPVRNVRNEREEQRVRVNEQIRISPVRLIDADGEQVGVVPIEDAQQTAANRGLDLVEVAPNARPPVVKVMDYGKYRFEQAKAARAAKKKQHVIHLKEVKYRPGISDHDFGNKVKLTMMFRGRQVTHPELGHEVLMRAYGEVEDVGKIEVEPKLEGRNMTMVLAPR